MKTYRFMIIYFKQRGFEVSKHRSHRIHLFFSKLLSILWIINKSFKLISGLSWTFLLEATLAYEWIFLFWYTQCFYYIRNFLLSAKSFVLIVIKTVSYLEPTIEFLGFSFIVSENYSQQLIRNCQLKNGFFFK